ncbi:hypothetical protein FACS189454_04030 [Planctomycetales bacterium]|nr:hypothetical protein FACS189454_04030 [Planctomycetales bacterium]
MVASLSDEFCQGKHLAMNRAYEGDENRQQAKAKGLDLVVPSKKNRKEPWEYDKELYKRRNEVERFNRKIKGFRRVFTRYDKPDMMYAAFVQFASICQLPNRRYK